MMQRLPRTFRHWLAIFMVNVTSVRGTVAGSW